MGHAEHQGARHIEVEPSLGTLLIDEYLDERLGLIVLFGGVQGLGQVDEVQQGGLDAHVVALEGVGLGQGREEGAFGGGVITDAQGVASACREIRPGVGGGATAREGLGS